MPSPWWPGQHRGRSQPEESATTRKHSGLALLALAFAVVGCASPPTQEGKPAPPGPAQPRTLVMVVNTEVKSLSPRVAQRGNPGRTTRVFNAGLTLMDNQGEVRPYLAESLPQLNTDTWQVFPDGRMETTWRLRAGLTWHDGEPLTAEDLVFAFEVYTSSTLAGIFDPGRENLVERIAAVDPRTVRIYWRVPFLHTGAGFEPLPRTQLAGPFAALEQDPAGQRDSFMALRLWSVDYMGAGPYQLTNWELGSHLEAAAFGGHALGRPKIDRIVIRFISDENTVLANVLAGQVDLVMQAVLGFEAAKALRNQGGFNDVERKGVLVPIESATITADLQHRPAYQRTPGLLDLRVRKAIAFATDKDAINEGLYEGQGLTADTFVRREASYYAEVDRAITKYPYDPRRAEALMREAGYSRDRDGFFADSAGQRFQPAFIVASVGAQRDQLFAILGNMWQEAGMDVQASILPSALEQDLEANATFPGLVVHGISVSLESGGADSLSTEQIGTPANRWGGHNRGGWSNPDYDLLWNRFNTTLARAEQVQALAQMMKLQSEQLPNLPLYSFYGFVPHVAALKGPDGAAQWNIHEWELAS